jgi:hypothetical protein
MSRLGDGVEVSGGIHIILRGGVYVLQETIMYPVQKMRVTGDSPHIYLNLLARCEQSV